MASGERVDESMDEFGRVRRVRRVWGVGSGVDKSMDEWWAARADGSVERSWRRIGSRRGDKAWTSRGRHERMGVLEGRGEGLDLGGARRIQTGAFVYPVVSQTTVSAQTPPLPVVGDFTAAKNIGRSSGNSNRQGGRGRRSRRESRRGRGRDWRCGWQG